MIHSTILWLDCIRLLPVTWCKAFLTPDPSKTSFGGSLRHHGGRAFQTLILTRRSHIECSDDPALYTITSDSTLRIFLPVVDAPHRLQLHASLDLFSSLPFLIAAKLGSHPCRSTVVWLDKEVVRRTIKAILASTAEDVSPPVKRLREIGEGDWDLFVRALWFFTCQCRCGRCYAIHMLDVDFNWITEHRPEAPDAHTSIHAFAYKLQHTTSAAFTFLLFPSS
jgi:hypothetical protein